MIVTERNTKNINPSLFYNFILTQLSKIFNCQNNYNLPVSIIDSFKLDIFFTDSNDYIAVPVKNFKYYEPSSNNNFQKELKQYILNNTQTHISCNESEDMPTINISINANIDEDFEDFKRLESNLNDFNVSDAIVNFYFATILEFLNQNNTKLIDNELFNNIEKYFNSFPYNPIHTKIYNEIIELCKINRDLINFKMFDSNCSKIEIDKVQYQDMIDNKVMFDTSVMSFDEKIAYAKIVNQIMSIEDAIYLIDLFYHNVNDTVFLGHCSSIIFKLYYDYSNDNAQVSDGILLFVYKCLNVGSTSEFNKRFPNPTAEELSLINSISFKIQEEFFSASMAYML